MVFWNGVDTAEQRML